MKFVRGSLFAANVIMFVTFLILLDAQGAHLIQGGDWEYKDLIAILLTVVTIILAFIGIIVAVAAIWGFQTLKSMAEEKAIETSKVGSSAFLRSEAFQDTLKLEIQTAIEGIAKDDVQDALAPLIVRNEDRPGQHDGDQEWQD